MEDQTKDIKTENFNTFLSDSDYNYLQNLDKEFLNNFDPEDDTTNFTEQDYANLQRNLVLFKEGNREATEYIIAAFHRILHSYAHFIVLHKVPYRKYIDRNGQERYQVYPSILNFIRLFGGKINEDSKKRKKNTGIFKDTCEYIYNLFSKYEYGDIYNELVLALINMANKYKIITDPNDPKYKPNGTFHVYVKKCFHFEAFHFLKELVNDPLMSFNLMSLTTEDENNYDYDNNVVCNSTIMVDESALLKYNTVIDYIDRQIQLQNSNSITLKEDKNLDLYNDDSLNFNWISGTVCGQVFKILTPYERELLILSYTKNQTEDTLASLYHCSRSTIGSHKRRAIEKLKYAIEQERESKIS